MLKRMGSIVLLAALAAVPVLRSTPALGQLTPEEAAAKLREKQAARSAMRDRIVQISQGELDDLKLKISGL
jgi:hypothetical protein